MDKILKIVGGVLIGLAIIFFAAFLGGTVVYWIWPAVIPVIFPGAVAAGTIVASVGWWKAVLFTWLCGILFKGSSDTSKSD